jgi:hypothetical protein
MDALRNRRCECGAADCTAIIQMTWAEQDRADHTGGRWSVSPGHEPRGARSWHVIEATNRYVIVEVDGNDEPSDLRGQVLP